MQPGEVAKVWNRALSNIVWANLPRSTEYNPIDVRYLWYSLKVIPAPSVPGSALRDFAALEPCWEGGHVSFAFSGDGLFKIVEKGLRLDLLDRLELQAHLSDPKAGLTGC